MKRNTTLTSALTLLAAFVLWTAVLFFADVRAVGPCGTTVGLGWLNSRFHHLMGVHMSLYTLTDWLSIIPLGIVVFFAGLGIVQLVKRKSLLKVDRDILLLGVFYIVVAAVFLFFEQWVVNYRPIFIDGQVEASYPSSTTLLVLCVMLTARLQCLRRVKNPTRRTVLSAVILLFTAFMVICRLISGVHWLTDIIGGALLGGGLVTLYRWATDKFAPM